MLAGGVPGASDPDSGVSSGALNNQVSGKGRKYNSGLFFDLEKIKPLFKESYRFVNNCKLIF